MGTIIVGVVIVGTSYLLRDNKNYDKYTATDVIIGLILLQVGQLFGALAYVAEEKFFGDCDDLDPMLVVGYEGIAGFILWIIVLPIFNMIPCKTNSICHNVDNVVESSLGDFRDFQANTLLII